MIASYFKDTSPTPILLPSSFDGRLARRQDLISAIDEMEKEKKQIEQELKLYMGGLRLQRMNSSECPGSQWTAAGWMGTS